MNIPGAEQPAGRDPADQETNSAREGIALSVATLHTPARNAEVSEGAGLRFAEESLPAAVPPVRVDRREEDGLATLTWDPERTSLDEIAGVLRDMQHQKATQESAGMIGRLHRRALQRAGKAPGLESAEVRQMQVEDAHWAALVDAEAQVYGRSVADQAVEVAVGLIRQAITDAADPAAVAERLMTVVGVTAEFRGVDVAEGNWSVTHGRSSDEDDHRAAGAEHGEGQ